MRLTATLFTALTVWCTAAPCAALAVPPFDRRMFVTSCLSGAAAAGAHRGALHMTSAATNGEEDDEDGLVTRSHLRVSFEGPVTERSCMQLRSALRAARHESAMMTEELQLESPPAVRLYIQSSGGSLLPTWGVINEITSCASSVAVDSYIVGFAASAATLISVACRRRFAGEHSIMLLHQLSAGAEGKLAAMHDQFSNLEMFDAKMKQLYLKHTRISEKELNQLLQHDLWLDAEKCLKIGLIDKIV